MTKFLVFRAKSEATENVFGMDNEREVRSVEKEAKKLSADDDSRPIYDHQGKSDLIYAKDSFSGMLTLSLSLTNARAHTHFYRGTHICMHTITLAHSPIRVYLHRLTGM